MYKTDFVCTYKSFEDTEDDEVTSDMLYQAQFLQVFGLTDYSESAISDGLELIKKKSEELPELKALIMQHPYNSGGADQMDELLPFMFAYPLLDVFHLCLIDAFNEGCISTESQNKVLAVYAAL